MLLLVPPFGGHIAVMTFASIHQVALTTQQPNQQIMNETTNICKTKRKETKTAWGHFYAIRPGHRSSLSDLFYSSHRGLEGEIKLMVTTFQTEKNAHFSKTLPDKWNWTDALNWSTQILIVCTHVA